MGLRRWQANCFEDSGDRISNLSFKASRVVVVDDAELGVTDPRINQLLVQSYRLIDRLISSLVVRVGVELRGAIRSRDHVDNSLVAAITQLNRAPMCIVKERLPNFSRRIGLAVHHASITNDYRRLLRFDRSFEEDIFEAHLRLHDLNLEADLVHQSHLVRLNEAAALHHKRCGFRHQEHLEPLGRQLQRQSGQAVVLPAHGPPVRQTR